MVRRAFRWLQRLGVRLAVAALACAVGSWFLIDWTDEGADDYAGGVVFRDTGDVEAMACSGNYFEEQVNTALAPRLAARTAFSLT